MFKATHKKRAIKIISVTVNLRLMFCPLLNGLLCLCIICVNIQHGDKGLRYVSNIYTWT